MLWNAKNGLVPVGGSVMHYVSFGHGGQAVIVLPGLSDGLTTVKGKALMLIQPYLPYLDRYTVFLFSRKDELPEGCTIREMAADQAAAMRTLGLKNACVLGVSEGGMIAQYLAIDAPELVSRLVIAVSACRVNPIIEENLQRWHGFAMAGDHRSLMIDTAEKSYSPQRLKKYRKYYPLLGHLGKPADYGRFLANLNAIRGFDAASELAAVRSPALILGGSEDQIVGGSASLELQERIAGSQLHLYSGLGHAAYEEAGDFYARVFRFFDAE